MKKTDYQFYYSFLIFILFISFDIYGSDYLGECGQCDDSVGRYHSDIFNQDLALNITLEFDFDQVLNSETEEEFPSELLCYDQEGNISQFHIKIKPRGNTRRMKSVCDFPPLKINFKKSEVKNTVFENQNKLKLVTHCKNNKIYEGYTLQEYYVYKTYNILTDSSLKVQLANITYIDKSGNHKAISRFGFFIESKKDMARRLNGEILQRKVITQNNCDTKSLNTFNMFQFMIGNTDWWVTTQHNVILLKLDSSEKPVPIPYDFDYAGLINTPYSVPHETIPISNVRQRYYKGSYQPPDSYEKIYERFLNRKKDLFELYDGSKYLSNHQKKASLNYYNSFYKILDNPKAIKKYFQQNVISHQMEI